MNKMEPHEKKELVDLLNKCWMTHDGMWFYSCLDEFGIEKANKVNKSAIRLLAPFEVGRMRAFLGMAGERLDSFDAFRKFFDGARELFIPDFMNATMSFPRENVMHWEFRPGECFAYKGMQRIGVIEDYQCGVLYRVERWIESLGIGYDINPKAERCLMLDRGECAGDFTLHF